MMVETVNHYASLWLNWQWSMLWQTAVLVAVVAVIDRLTRKWAWPQLRYALWLLVLVKLMLPPTLTSPISVTSTVPALAQNVIETSAEEPAPMAIETPAASMAAVESSALNVQPPAPVATESHAASTVPVAVAAPALSWAACAMAVWLFGVLALGIGLVVYLRRLAAEHAEPRPDDVPEWFDDVLAQAAREIGLGRAPRVVFSRKVCCPAVFAVFRPVVLIPAEEVATMTRSETRHVLLHELAHIKRGDLWVHAVQMGLMILYWFNPLLWLMRKHVQNLRELCCDATVARHLREEAGAYRQTLLATGRALLARPIDPGLGLLGLYENPGWLAVRLDWLQKNTWRRPWLRRISVTLVIALMLACVLPMAALSARDDTIADQYRVTLPNGATVELVGLYSDACKQWWRPDGTPLDKGPYDRPHIDDSGHPDGIEFAVRYENLPSGTEGGVGMEPGGGSWGGRIPSDDKAEAGAALEGMAYVVVAPREGTETGTVKVRLAMGFWKTQETYSAKPGQFWGEAGLVRFLEPYEHNGKTKAAAIHMIEGVQARLTVCDLNDVEHEPIHRGGMRMGRGTSWMEDINGEFDITPDHLTAINFQTRPYTYVEFKNISLRPDKPQEVEIVTTEVSGAKAQTPQTGYCATLPNGATIELVGLCDKKAQRWWGPDGRSLEKGLLDPDMPHGPPWMDCTKIFLRYEDLPDGTVGNFWVDPGRGYWGGGIPILRHLKARKNGRLVENLTWLEATVDEGTERTSVKVKLAMGNWQDHITLPFKPRNWTSYSVAEVTVFEPYERDGQTRIPIVHTIRDRDVRIIAIDVSDVEHESLTHGGAGSRDFRTTTAVFDMPLDDIAALRVQKRPYTRIEFKNVSVVPGQFQTGEIVTTGAQLLPEQDRPVDVAEIRKQSPQFLKAFQAGVKEYCKRNGWGNLPPHLWSIPFKLNDEIEVHPSYFTEFVGYFGPDGLQSLRPDYFRSPLASTTPIAYCKRLLEAEQGKGTNVLFGDGRVEWVTSTELNRLKVAGMPEPN